MNTTPRYTVHPKERLYFALMTLFSIVIYGLIATGIAGALQKISWEVVSTGAGPAITFYTLFFIFLAMFSSAILVGNLRSNGININPTQFPEVYDILRTQAQVLGLPRVPEMHVIQAGGMLNAFAMRFARRNFVTLYSAVLEAAYAEGKEAVAFIIGHELGHIKHNHVSTLKFILTLPARMIPFLGGAYGRACEYTCDRVGFALSPEGSIKGLLILGAGTKLAGKVNLNSLMNQRVNFGFAVWLAEIFATHPPLVKRLEAIKLLNREQLHPTTPAFITPHVQVVAENNHDQVAS